MLKRVLSIFVASAVTAVNIACSVVCVSAEEKPIAKEIKITMDGLTSKGLPSDISVKEIKLSQGTYKLYTAPDMVTADTIAANVTDDNVKKLFYYDSNESGHLMLNSHGSDNIVRIGLDKAEHNKFTGFDEIRIKYKFIKVIGDGYNYKENLASNYPLKLRLSDWNASAGTFTNTTLTNSKQLSIKPEKFNVLADTADYSECVFARSDFVDTVSGSLDMDGKLEPYTDENEKDHMMVLSFWTTSRTSFLIDEVSFVWYGEEPTPPGPVDESVSLKNLTFENNGEVITETGLKVGLNEMTATVCNSTQTDINDARIILALYDKKTDMLSDVALSFVTAAAGGEENIELSVNVPDGSDPNDFEARVMMFQNFESLKPLLKSVYRFDGSGEVKD